MIALKLIAGFVLLVLGAESLVRGASKIAAAVGISPLIIGLTVVSFGTSAPELAVSVGSALRGNADIAIGNVVGSNILNILFILGLSSLFLPLVVHQQLVRLDVPIMIGASLLTLLFAWDGRIYWWEGVILVAMGIGYIVFLIRLSRKEKNKGVLEDYEAEYGEENKPKKGKVWVQPLFVLAGLGLLLLGSSFLVDAAVNIAQSYGVSELIIGLTIIAIGTSLPEAATSIIASIKKEEDIAVGNAVGSNIFNLLFILGITAMVAPGGVPVNHTAIQFDIPFMTAVAVACLPFFLHGYRLDRWKGFVFLFYYLAYTGFLILKSTKNGSLEIYTDAMLWFVVPLTLLTLVGMMVQEMRKRRQ
ncbi:MAG: calcium/sodium antiporter [Saprospiraceae bacterium]|nr:calcium/sodium antiporter [Saprospiraceae bacterium]MCF8252664.1 calcium/sodium antiporter [Saprospiraceae bacterium]MCF8282863.1 calcium/sodium antiporter [Bacteroidales bacterium]MCF8314236.1 calcium/sodium antiporter [Saprospiraceae bacterium]MCF8443045.1 calcium/sodium antiporter [Saprospiraceae bacterium]